MTVLNFPANPANGEQYSANGIIYTWNGSAWTASDADDLDDRFVQVNGDTMTGDLTVPSLNSGPLAGFRNHLINGILDHWQRGTSGFSGVGAYTADRWVLGGNSPAASRVTVTTTDANAGVPCTYGISISSSGGTYATIRQGIELIGGGGRPNQFQVGSQWTLSFYANTQTLADVSSGYSCGFSNDANLQAGSPGAWTLGTYQKLENVGGTWARYSVTYTVNNAPVGSNLCVSVPLSSKVDGSAVVYTGIQFEPGPVATVLEARPVQTELALCQRYYVAAGRIFAYVYRDPVSTRILSREINMRAAPSSSITGAIGGPFSVGTSSSSTFWYATTSSATTGSGAYATVYLDAEL